MAKKRTRIIAIANEKGGVGKTATVINLGAALTKENKHVLIVDMDPQAGATQGLGIEIKDGLPTVYNMIMDNNSFPFEKVAVNTRWKGIDIIPSNSDLSGAEVELVEIEGRENKLKESLERADGLYDFILVDTPPSLSLLTVNVFAFAKEVLVPCQTHPYAYTALKELFDTIEAIKEEINPDLKIIGLVATFFDHRTRVCRGIMDKLMENEDTKKILFKTVIRANTTIAESAYVGKPVVFYRSTSFGATDYFNLAKELQQRN